MCLIKLLKIEFQPYHPKKKALKRCKNRLNQ
jgi:hypothetical protein